MPAADRFHCSLAHLQLTRQPPILVPALILVATPLLAQGAPPYPPSPVIRSITFAPAESIRCAAQDGDNFPVTWGADDAIYTTWGDGTGFEPKVPVKLSMGYARVTGGPHDFVGENIRSPNEQMGSGRSGKKGWGLLSIDGTL